MSRLPSIPAFAVLLQACAPQTLWLAKSPDRRHRVAIEDARGGQRVLFDGKELGRHDGVAVSTFTFSRDGRQWAYAARRGDRWEIISSLGRSPDWDGVGGVRISPRGDRLAFSAERKGSWHVVADFREGPGFQELLQDAFLFSADGRRLAYAGLRGGKARVAVDQVLGPEFDAVGKLAFDAGSRPFYVARRGDSAHLVLDGVPGPGYGAITEVASAPSGLRLAYLARKGDSWHAVVDGRESAPFPALSNLAFRPDGNSVAWIARHAGRDVLVQDGIQQEADYPRILAGTVAFPPGAERPVYVAVTEQGKQVLVEGGKEGPAYDEISARNFGSAPGSIGYAARNGRIWVVLVDGKEVAREEWAASPVFGSEGRFAYVARRGAGSFVVAAGISHPFDVILDDTLVFGPDGRRWGCIAGTGTDGGLYFVVDGRKTKPLDLAEVAGEAVKGESDGETSPARAWVRAELALAGS